MSKLLVRSSPPAGDGCVVRVTPESVGWQFVGFEVYRDAALTRYSPDRETCVVVLSGRADLAAGGMEWGGVGERETVFEGGPPAALYVPPGVEWAAEGDELAVCTAPASGGLEPRLLRPSDARHESRGSGQEARDIFHILMEDQRAESLLVTEVHSPPGNWSSYPPHKHDVDDPPRETFLEETYYHRVRGPGFGFQRVYTGDRSLDEAIAISDGDLVCVPYGYHPVVAGARHEHYYLNVMAGPVREWHITVDPAFSS